MKIVDAPGIPPANGHYSTCIEHAGVLYLSGQLPLLPGTKECPSSIEEQTLLVLNKIEQIVNAAGSSVDKIINVRLYISDIELWNQVNKVYAEFFGNHRPVRAVIPTKELHYGCLIEAEATAAL